ncbi:hypothetical protein FJZ33_06210, partial [Candidatus Poribacteria bacterium]|nr:hypothetical protein [Candidatus Poribacteria bacterium]
MGLSPDLPPTIKELISSFGNLIEEYEKEIHYFTSVVDKHVRVLEHDPFQKSLDSLLMDHEHKLDEFDKGLRENLQKIDAEIELNSKKYIDMIKNIERSKEQLATVITNISGRLSQTNIDIEDHVDMAMDFYEIIHGMAKMVLEYFGV